MEISIVMPVYNGEKYIAEAISSVLNQTFRDFEFIIVNDGSTDKTIQIIKKFKDPRIHLIHNNHDFIQTLNKGIIAARGKYIARMDADDIMLPQRLEIQYQVMKDNPEITICSSYFEAFGQYNGICGLFDGKIQYPLLHMLEGNIIAHPTVMIRKTFLQQHKLQYEYYDYAEDYKLWSEIAKCQGIFYVIPKALIKYRISQDQITQKKSKEQETTVLRIQNEILDFLINHCPLKSKEIKELSIHIFHLNEQNLISEKTTFSLFSEIFNNIFYSF